MLCVTLGAVAWGRDLREVLSDYTRANDMVANGQYKECIDLTLRIMDELKASRTHLANAYTNLATSYKNIGELAKAREAFTKALEVDSHTDSRQRQSTLVNLSNLQILMGDYDGCLSTLDKVTDPQQQPARLLNRSQALYFSNRDTLDVALSLIDSCLTIDGLALPVKATAFQNKGYLLSDNRRYAEAAVMFEHALAISDPSAIGYYQTLGNLALAEAYRGHLDKAWRNIRRAIDWFAAHKAEEDLRIAHRKAGQIKILAGDKTAATAHFRKFFDDERRNLLQQLPTLSPTMRLNLWVKEKPLLARCFMLEDAAADFLFDVAMFRRQTSLLGLADTKATETLLQTGSAQLRKALRPDETAMEMICYEDPTGNIVYAALLLQANGRARFVRLFDESETTEPSTADGLSLLQALKSEQQETIHGLYTDSLWGRRVWQPVIDALPSTTKKIYFAPEGIFHLWAIESLPWPGENRPELHRVSSTAGLVAHRNKKKSRDEQRATPLVVGGLNYDLETNDSFQAEYPNHDAAERLRSHGDFKFKYLPGSLIESDSVAAILAVKEPMHEMDEAHLKNILPKFRNVHIATHGYSLDFGVGPRPEFLADSVPFDSSLLNAGLALSGANLANGTATGEDGLLSARELCSLDLSGVDFVVLSACQTARGSITDEGGAGLLRGLKNGGAKSVMASLWSVDDFSTIAFMSRFYRELSRGASKYEAYEAARRSLMTEPVRIAYHKFNPATLIRSKKISYAEFDFNDPFYWAPFILIDSFE